MIQELINIIFQANKINVLFVVTSTNMVNFMLFQKCTEISFQWSLKVIAPTILFCYVLLVERRLYQSIIIIRNNYALNIMFKNKHTISLFIQEAILLKSIK